MAARLVPRRPAAAVASSTLAPGVPGLSRGGLFGHRWDGCHDDRHLLLASSVATSIPVRSSEARTATTPASPKPGTRRPEGALPPTSLTTFRKACALRIATSRHGCPVLPPPHQLPTDLHDSTRESLDFRGPRLFAASRQPPAACRLLQQDVTRARQRPARPSTSRAASCPLVQWHHHEDDTSRAFSGQGSGGRTCCVTPTGSTARVGGFTPT